MIQRIFFILMAAFFIAACSEQGAEQAPQKKPEQKPEQVRLENPGTVLYFEEAEMGVEPYGSRMLVNPDYLRLDDGHNEGDFILYDRKERAIYSVAHAEKSILKISYHPVEIEPPYELKLVDDVREDASAPVIGSQKPEHHVYMVNSQRCFDAILVPGILDAEATALKEYLEVLAGEQARNLFKTPVEYQEPCMLSNLIFNAGAHLEHGFPIQESSNTGYSRYLVDYRKSVELAPDAFKLPGHYRQFSLEPDQPVVQ